MNGRWIWRELVEERTDKGMGHKEKRKRNVKLVEELRVEKTATYNEMFRMNCETFEEILTAIGPVITKTADRKLSWTIIRVVKREKLSWTIMNNLNKLKMNDSWW